MMKWYVRCFAFIALFLFPVFVIAQEEEDIKVESFKLYDKTNYANTHGYIVEDLNGEKCALIIVDTRNPELLTFDSGGAGVMHTECKADQGQVWVYVPGGVKRLSIFGKGMTPLRDHDLGESVQGARTYLMKVTTNDVVTTEINDDIQVVMHVKVVSEVDDAPITEANFSINGVKENLDENGVYEKQLSGATYRYRVEAKYYKTTSGTFVVDGKSDEYVIKLKPDYEMATITAPQDCQIWVDDKFVGKESWTGRLLLGERKITCKLDKHYDLDKIVTVVEGTPVNLFLENPNEIQGTLTVMSTLLRGANVFIDGRMVGTTPYEGAIIIGDHTVEVRAQGYATYREQVTIKQDWLTNVMATMKQASIVHINTQPVQAEVTIDGDYMGKTPTQVELRFGKHDLALKSQGYYTLKKTVKIAGDQTNLWFKLKRRRFKPYEFYFGGGYSVMPFEGYQACVGTYLGNVNIEYGYWEELGASEPIYWYTPNTDSRPVKATYYGSIYKVRLGYGIALNNRFRITPQVGLSHVVLNEEVGNWQVFADGAYSSNFSAGLKIDVALSRWAALTIVPDYTMGIEKSPGYLLLEGVSDHIKGLSDGVGVCVNFNIRF